VQIIFENKLFNNVDAKRIQNKNLIFNSMMYEINFVLGKQYFEHSEKKHLNMFPNYKYRIQCISSKFAIVK